MKSSPVAQDLVLDRVNKSFGRFQAISDVSLNIRQGEFLTLLGPSGSGKTTLLMMIAGFLTTDSGVIRLRDRDITSLPPEKRNFGMVFQGYALFPHLSVFQNVAFPLQIRRRPKAEIAERVNAALELVQLTDRADRLPRQLSGGQQQRVALARAMVFTPHLLLLDEPLSALDKKLRSEMQEELKRLHRKVGLTFIYVTHDQDEALSMSDRIVVMRDGKVVQAGAPAELYRKPASSFVAGFLGKSNFLHGTVAAHEPGGFVLENAGQRIRQVSDAPLALSSPAVIGVRPESMTVLEPGETADNSLAGTVRECAYYGSAFHLSVEAAPFGTLEVEIPASRFNSGAEPGSSVTLGWPRSAGMPLPQV
ncbi:ABC transporter ATP-binding protein [Halodurantibacterium flavum]|uniref:Spermidine/putrescine import ATP-binding protein PotA n=1 Tax=Halodurantibacterium flavum TaxID=1382802 RepID=A0ABW4RZA4_9RHOB